MTREKNDDPFEEREREHPIERQPDTDRSPDDDFEGAPGSGSSRSGNMERGSYEIYGDERGGQKPTRP